MSERSSLCWRDRERAFYIGGNALAAQIQNEIHVGKAATFPLKALISTPQRSVNDMAQIQYRLSRHGLFHLMMRLRHHSTAVLSAMDPLAAAVIKLTAIPARVNLAYPQKLSNAKLEQSCLDSGLHG